MMTCSREAEEELGGGCWESMVRSEVTFLVLSVWLVHRSSESELLVERG